MRTSLKFNVVQVIRFTKQCFNAYLHLCCMAEINEKNNNIRMKLELWMSQTIEVREERQFEMVWTFKKVVKQRNSINDTGMKFRGQEEKKEAQVILNGQCKKKRDQKRLYRIRFIGQNMLVEQHINTYCAAEKSSIKRIINIQNFFLHESCYCVPFFAKQKIAKSFSLSVAQ